ncbi:hypothetical protein BJX61DRAFT_539758 [Aspergillus egyptiacus]|nr:hypothetical protein BJX61DRAFT_539758 [Aspergillus egyptiacus]
METTAGPPSSLVSLGKDVDTRFSSLLISVDPSYKSSVLNEIERFDRWASSLGLYLTGHSSLDYRFRDSPPLYQYACGLLQDLLGAIATCKCSSSRVFTGLTASCKVGGLAQHDRSDFHHEEAMRDTAGAVEWSDDESEEDFSSYQTQPLPTEYLANISMSIDRLYALAYRIRNPKTRTGLSWPLEYTEVNPETGVNLIGAYEQWDLRHIKGLLRAWWNGRDMDDHFLIPRLAKANTLRRQRFKYWENRKAKFDYYHRAAIDGRVSGDGDVNKDRHVALSRPSEPSTATTLDPDKIPEDRSLGAADSYALAAGDCAALQSIPPPPDIDPSSKEFECPYCFILCGSHICAPQAWRTHVMRDLRPYTCTVEHCREADQQYDTFSEWITHELSEHGVHPTSVRRCPLCPCADARAVHVAGHLRQIAVFSLPPRDTGEEYVDESAQKAGSNIPALDTSSDADSALTEVYDEWMSNRKTITLRLDGNRELQIELSPNQSLRYLAEDALQKRFGFPDQSIFQFLDSNGNEIPLDYESLFHDMVIFVRYTEPPYVDHRPESRNTLSLFQGFQSQIRGYLQQTHVPISPHPFSGSPLHRRYVVQIPALFHLGKVFDILWHANSPRQGAGTQTPCQSPVISGSTISTYGGRGVAKPGVDASKHAVVYMRDTEPFTSNDEPPMGKEPLEIIPDQSDVTLHQMSRLNFGKIYTVEHNASRFPIGRIATESMPRFLEYAGEELPVEQTQTGH